MEDCAAPLAAVRNMDKEALAKVFDLYAPAIYRYAFRLCSNEWIADDVVGAVFTRLLDHLCAGRGPTSNIRSYLYQIAYHLVIDETRYSRRTEPIEVIDWLLNVENSPTRAVEEQLVVDAIHRAITNDLTDDQKHVIILRFLEGFSLKETAMITGKKIGNVRVIQNRAIATLRNVLNNIALGSMPIEIKTGSD